ncbi:MAG: tRNA (N(6)-L-threonylcarbamoyladenosine(37)-C(2))-methylthiotransferase MtaB [Bacteroidetes bacterium]|jgi:threonylcarbamoyladenosine tRNA methylthiotransferase MtaB|nr:tRNA (N(6)-L-threonylcarbamoyladenosine(37)-C(2))-methylthiotransferase MtaB [Bacteroidota bacterium]
MAEHTDKKVSLYTLGCKLNFAETSTIGRQFETKGYQKVDFSESADVVVINTCSVTDHADKKCRQVIKKARKLNPDAYIAVVGCYAQLQPSKISQINGVDLVVGTQDKFKVADLVNKYQSIGLAQIHACAINEVKGYNSSFSVGDRTRSFLKVQDGCDYFCSFCTIPYARGMSRNSSIADVVQNAQKIADSGVKEIVLTGVNIGDFGRSTGEDFLSLIKALNDIEGIKRYRISSIEPNLLTNEIIQFVAASDKFMPHFHIPLQSGNNKMLSLMKRKYQRELYQERVEYIKNIMPDAFIGCDVIVGHPGESQEDFLTTYRFIEDMDVSALHVFTYSDRKDALSYKIKQKVNPKEKARRSEALQELSNLKKRAFYSEFIGHRADVLFEKQQAADNMSGFTKNYIKVEHPYDKDLVGQIRHVNLDQLSDSGNVGVSLINNNVYELS